MSSYFCEPCTKFFSGKIPYECHLASYEHKNVYEMSLISEWEHDPFIKRLGKDYECTLCKTFLNSMSQVRCHARGAKHLKEKSREGLSPNSSVLSSYNRIIDEVDNFPSAAALGHSEFQAHMIPDDENLKVLKASGITRYESHLADYEPNKKINETTSVAQDFRSCSFNSSDWEQDPFIKRLGKDYECTLCKTFLNSMSQVRCHARGAKHLKEKSRESLSANSSVLSHNRIINQVGSISSSTLTDGTRSRFDMHDGENLKEFKPRDIVQCESHLASYEHMKNVSEPTPTSQDFRECSFNSSDWKQDPFIMRLEQGYKCALCNTYLNSMDQVRCHIRGAKHTKEKSRVELSSNSSVLLSPNRSIDQVGDVSSSSALAGVTGSRDQFLSYIWCSIVKSGLLCYKTLHDQPTSIP